MIDLSNNVKRDRLLKAIKSSRDAMIPFRRVRKELIKDYVGSWYSESGAENKTLVNLIHCHGCVLLHWLWRCDDA